MFKWNLLLRCQLAENVKKQAVQMTFPIIRATSLYCLYGFLMGLFKVSTDVAVKKNSYFEFLKFNSQKFIFCIFKVQPAPFHKIKLKRCHLFEHLDFLKMALENSHLALVFHFFRIVNYSLFNTFIIKRC